MNRYLVVGMGAIGVYLGGSLRQAGAQVGYVEQPELVAVRRAAPPRLKTTDGEYSLAGAPIFESIAVACQVQVWDAVIIAVKTFDTDALLPGLAEYRTLIPCLVSLQNGVENEEKYQKALGEGKVVPGSITTAVGKSADGSVFVEKMRGIALAAESPGSQQVAADFSAAGLNPSLTNGWQAIKWSKLLTNLQANASVALLNMRPAEVFAHPGLFNFEMRQLREALQVMRQSDFPVVDLPRTPVNGLRLLATRIPAFFGRPLAVRLLGKGRGEKMPSFHIDLYGGRKQSEVGDLNGAVVRAAERLGLLAPVNAFLTNRLEALVMGKTPINAYDHQPELLLEDFRKFSV